MVREGVDDDADEFEVKPPGHIAICVVAGLVLSVARLSAQDTHHYVFFNRDRERIAERSFLETPAFEGAQLKYMWRELEPAKNQYDFSGIEKDLDFLTSHGKTLFIQLQDVTFDTAYKPIPRYLMTDTTYHGGACTQLEVHEDGTTTAFGWVARRWDPAVQERMHRLFDTLGARFDGRIEGVNLPETAVDFGIDEKTFPPGFSYDAYRDAVIANMKALKKAFPKSLALLYSNFMPGEWEVPEGRSYLRDLYDAAAEFHNDRLRRKRAGCGLHFLEYAGAVLHDRGDTVREHAPPRVTLHRSAPLLLSPGFPIFHHVLRVHSLKILPLEI